MFEVIISFLIAVTVVYLAYQVLKGNPEPADAAAPIENVKKVEEEISQKLTEVEPTKEVVLEPTKEVEQVAPVVAEKPKRARNKGKFKADDKATTETNEAWVDGKAPTKKEKAPANKKPRKPKMTVVK